MFENTKFCKSSNFSSFALGTIPIICTSAKELGGWGWKMNIFANVQYCIYADIVGGSEIVQKYADII